MKGYSKWAPNRHPNQNKIETTIKQQPDPDKKSSNAISFLMITATKEESGIKQFETTVQNLRKE